MKTPAIDASALIEYAKNRVPDALISHEIVSHEHKSWRLKIQIPEKVDLEFFWGPLTGFGATDFLTPPESDDPNPFDPYDLDLSSMEHAKAYIDTKAPARLTN